MHTFIPDQADINGWLVKLFKTRQEFYVDLHRYAEALAHPDPDRVKRFIEDVNFYDRDDPLIRLARALQEGTPSRRLIWRSALDEARGQSLYAQALARGYGYLQAASDYFIGDIGQEALKDRLERGAQGV